MHLFLDFCLLWLLVDSAIWFNHLLFTDVCTFNVNEKRLYQRSLVCGLWIHRSLRISFWEKLTWKEEINWLLDFTKPDTICTLCKHGFRLFHIYVLTNGITFSYWEKVLLLIFLSEFFFIQKGGGHCYLVASKSYMCAYCLYIAAGNRGVFPQKKHA